MIDFPLYAFALVGTILAPQEATQPASDSELLNAVTDSAVGQENDDGFVKWELRYHVAIAPYIQDYRRCLNYGNRIASGVPDMELQYRTDIPRCAEVLEESVAESKSVITRRDLTEIMSSADVEQAFKVIGYIHIERGRNLDDQLVTRVQKLETYGGVNAQSGAPSVGQTSE